MEKTMDVIAAVRELGKALQQDARYDRFMAAKTANDNDEALQALIGEFNLKRIGLNELMNASERDEEKISAYDREVRDLYEKIMTNGSMMEYNVAKHDIDALTREIQGYLSLFLNGEDPETAQYEAPGGCGGNCSSCSGCH